MYVLVWYHYSYIVRFPGEGENDKKKANFPDDSDYFFHPSYTWVHGVTV